MTDRIPAHPCGRASDRPRPCRRRSCRLHLQAGSAASCLLDLVEAHPDGLSAGEVAKLLGLTVETVRAGERRALEKLLEAMDG